MPHSAPAPTPHPKPSSAHTEFDRQLEHLMNLGYPALLEQTPQAFKTQLEGLRAHLGAFGDASPDLETGTLPFVIVVRVPADAAFERLRFNDKPALLSLYPAKLEDFNTRDDLKLPDANAYLLLNVDRGRATLNVTPETALETIRDQGRTPLTVLEGIAVLTQYPAFLQKNNCFSLLGSRRGDQRVPALWISARQAKLGWCWDRNPHTWLGSASCAARAGL